MSSRLPARAAGARHATGPNQVLLSVDGGVGPTTIATVAATDADIVVAGSAVFGSDDPVASAALLIDEMERGRGGR
jgi:ribulose-phosphate 3-epimerase